jgi:formylglycine-generating enzyme
MFAWLALAALAGFASTSRADPAAALAAPITNSIGMKLVYVPSGTFLMGSRESPEEAVAFYKKALGADRIDLESFRDQCPQHSVRITQPFYLAACNVTRGQFRRFVDDTNYKTTAEMGGWAVGAYGFDAKTKTVAFAKQFSWRNTGFEQSDEHPVLCVSWHDAAIFCRWLSRKDGRTYRLPTEAEWEYACRAGTTTRFSCGDDPERLAEAGNVADARFGAAFANLKGTLKASDGYVFTSPVGSFRVNAFALYDMHGNAQQWCSDWYGNDYYAASQPADPQGPKGGEYRVVRGSTWASPAWLAGSALRSSRSPTYGGVNVGFRVAMAAGRDASDQPAERRFEPRITISPETTRIVGPLDKDGNVDYLAALNQHCRLGVTAENNAAIPLWQALGPARITPGTEARFFEMLGIRPLPREGKCLVLLNEYADAHQKHPIANNAQGASAWDRYAPALQRPWSAGEFPLLADWLEANTIPLAKLHEAAARSRYYSPLLNETGSTVVLTVPLPDAEYLREGARLLMVRATLRLHDGRVQESWQDVLACHRLARLCGQKPIIVQQLVARRLSQQACRATAVLAARGELDAKLAAKMLADLDALPPLPRSADALNLGERSGFLDTLGRIARGGPRELRRLVGLINELSSPVKGSSAKTSASDVNIFPDRWTHNESVDWDLVAMFGNRWFDMLAEVSDKSPAHRVCRGVHEDMGKQLTELTDHLAGGGDARQIAKLNLFVGNIRPEVKSFDLFGIAAGLLTPACGAMDWSEYRAQAEFQLARLSLALAVYHRRTGRYPATLDALAPSILPNIPQDPFTDKPMHYEARGRAYRLYSLGPSETDEGGRDRDSNPPGWNVILPLPPSEETRTLDRERKSK